MTQDEIIDRDEVLKMARHVASTFGTRMCDENGDTHGQELYCMDIEDIVDIIKLVDAKATAKEREACAKVCDELKITGLMLDAYSCNEARYKCAEAIRSRGEA